MTVPIPVGIAGVGHSVPDRVIDNDWFTQFVDTSDEWIVQRTGISQRRWLEDGEKLSDHFAACGKAALEQAGVLPSEVDLVIIGTVSPDYLVPSVACIVQDKLGCEKAGAFDINAGCAGFLYTLSVGRQFIASGAYKNVLVLGGEALSRITDIHDRGTVVLFADGCGGVLLRRHDDCEQGLIEDLTLGSDGSGYHFITRPVGGSYQSITQEDLAEGNHLLRMQGRDVYRFAVDQMTGLMEWAMDGQDISELGWVIPHQMNKRILETATARLEIPPEKVYINIDRFGNTSAGTVPICLSELSAHNKLEKNSLLVMAAFGAGLAWAGARIRW